MKGFVKAYNISPNSIPILGSSLNLNNQFKKLQLTYTPEMLYISKSDYRLSYSFNVGGNNIQIKKSIEYTRDIINEMGKLFINKILISADIENLSVKYHKLEHFQYEDVKYNINGMIKDKKSAYFKTNINKSKLCILILCNKNIKNNIINLLDYIKKYLNQNLISQENKIDVEFIYIENKDEISENIVYDSSLIILQYKKDSNYNTLKEYFNKKEIPSQMICQSTINTFNNMKKDKWEKYNKDNLVSNICLGLLYKMNISPWKLSSKTKSDCFIAFDVSHEDGKHFSSCIAIIQNNDGTFDNIYFGQKERGELISAKTLKLFLNKVLDKHKEINNNSPSHITIHRDGFLRESEINVIKKVMDMKKNKTITFTMVSILKRINRKIFTFDNKFIKSPKKIAFINRLDNTALLILTEINFDLYNASKNSKLSCPIKIEIKHNNSKLILEDIINDINKLSCLRFHTTNKTKLPLTIEYADKHSTSFNRNILQTDKEYFINYMP
jgi:hypothetical protein